MCGGFVGDAINKVVDDVAGFDPGGGGVYGVVRDVVGDDIGDDLLGFDPNGGGIVPLTNAAAKAALTYAAGQGVGSLFSGASSAGSAADAAFAAADASQLAGQGLSQSQIASTLTASGVDAMVAADAAQLAAQGLSASQIAPTLTQSYGKEIFSLPSGSTATSAAKTAKTLMDSAKAVNSLLGTDAQVQLPAGGGLVGTPGLKKGGGGVDYSQMTSLLPKRVGRAKPLSLV